MTKIADFLRQHYGKIFVGTSGTIIFTVVGIFFSDARYVHQDKYRATMSDMNHQIVQLQAEVAVLKTRLDN